MSITDELRRYIGGPAKIGISHACWGAIRNIADRIDEVYKRALDERDFETIAEGGWVKLPVDADGELIHIGDVLTDGEYKFEVYELTMYGGGSWSIYNENGHAWAACDVTHCHTPTVEDLLKEFFSRYATTKSKEEDEAIISEYATKLRLADGGNKLFDCDECAASAMCAD